MKSCIVFILLLFVTSLQGFGQNSIQVKSFYSGTSVENTITETDYLSQFNIELALNITETNLSNVKVVVEMPANTNISYISRLVSEPVVISQWDLVGTKLEFVVNGYVPGNGFTINITNVSLNAITDCSPKQYAFNTHLSYTLNQNTIQSTSDIKSISVKHVLGQLATENYWGGDSYYYYDNGADANSPIYYDVRVSSTLHTYNVSGTGKISLEITANMPVFNVVNLDTKTFATKTSTNTYLIPFNGNQNYRIFFNTDNVSDIKLIFTVKLKHVLDCVVEDNLITRSFETPNIIQHKNDDALLTFPYIYESYTYLKGTTRYSTCSAELFSANFKMDNFYNGGLNNAEMPIVTTFEHLDNFDVRRIDFNNAYKPDNVVVSYDDNTSQTIQVNSSSNVNVQSNKKIVKIKMTYVENRADISSVSLNYYVRDFTITTSYFDYNLLRNNNIHISLKHDLNKNPDSQNSVLVFKSANPVYRINDVIYVTMRCQIFQDFSSADYLQYDMAPSMHLVSDVDSIQFSVNNSTYYSLDEFNALYKGTNSAMTVIKRSASSIRINNVFLKKLNSCYTVIYLRVKSQVNSRPVSVSNINYFHFNSSGDVQYDYDNYPWSVLATKNIVNSINLSCNELVYTENVKIKSNDPVSVAYNLENQVPIKYTTKPVEFYFTLIKPGVTPELFVTQINGLNGQSIKLPSTSYSISYATGNFTTCGTLLNNYCSGLPYLQDISGSSNIAKVTVSNITLDYYDQLILNTFYDGGLNLNGTINLQSVAMIDNLFATSVSGGVITVGPKSDCDLVNCEECITSFSPTAGDEYILSAWVKESFTGNPPTTYKNSGVRVTFTLADGTTNTLILFRPAGPIVDGWQRIETSFVVPGGAKDIHIALVNESGDTDVFFDDIRIHPYNSNMKSFVYNPSTQKLVAELDENNFATMYEYDDEGILIRVKKETERGVMTIKETRSNQSKIK